jgi:hypothetical protein
LPTCESEISLPPTALGMAPTFLPIPNPLSRTQFVIVRLPMPPEPAVAARAPMSPQSTGWGMPERRKNPANVCAQCAKGTKRTLTAIRKTKTTPSIVHAKYSSMRSIVPPNDSTRTTTSMSTVATSACVGWSGAPGMRPIHAPRSVAAALPARAGHPSWKKPSTM